MTRIVWRSRGFPSFRPFMRRNVWNVYKQNQQEKLRLRSHIVMASRSRPFQCTDCSRRFHTDRGLAVHQRAVHGMLVMASQLTIRPFECTVCSKRFTTDKGCAEHKRAVHGGLVVASRPRPFQCTDCSRRFHTDRGLAVHQRAVHGMLVMASQLTIRPFECTVCSKRFTTDKGCAEHKRAVHGGLVMASRFKPYECTVCSKRFTTDKGRAAHQRAVHCSGGNHFVPVSIFSIKVSDGGALTGGVPFAFYGSSFAKIVGRSSLAVTRNVVASRHIEVENPHFQ